VPPPDAASLRRLVELRATLSIVMAELAELYRQMSLAAREVSELANVQD